MSRSFLYPLASRGGTLNQHITFTNHTAVLMVSDVGDVGGFLELLELIYGGRVHIVREDQAQFKVSVHLQVGQTLAGVRVAARACQIEFEEWMDIIH
jgi:hypothetical protein